MVLRTAPCREQQAAANAENKLSLESYAPKLKTFNQVQPLFPGYSFACTPTDQWLLLLKLNHVRGILMAGDHPSWVPESVIAEIRSQEDADSGIVCRNPRFTFRQRLAITSGPFTHGLYLGLVPGNRVRLLFELLGKEHEATLDLSRLDLSRLDIGRIATGRA